MTWVSRIWDSIDFDLNLRILTAYHQVWIRLDSDVKICFNQNWIFSIRPRSGRALPVTERQHMDTLISIFYLEILLVAPAPAPTLILTFDLAIWVPKPLNLLFDLLWSTSWTSKEPKRESELPVKTAVALNWIELKIFI